MRITVRGGRVIDPAEKLDAVRDLHVADGRIAAIGRPPDGFRPERTIDAEGMIALPGLVDLSVHLGSGDPASALDAETRAAVAGGITTLCTPPDITPCVDTPAAAELVRLRAEQYGYARVLTLGGLTHELAGEALTEIGALKRAGCIAVGNGPVPVADSLMLRRALEYAASLGMTVFSRPVDSGLARGGCAHEGAVATRLGLPAIPAAAETVGLARDLALVELTGARAHFCRLSTADGVDQVRDAQRRGLPVTADVAIHQLYLCDEDILSFDALCHVDPPLRGRTDRDALRAGVADGTIRAITSDHRPLGGDAKRAPFPATRPGIAGLASLLPLVLELTDDGLLPLAAALETVTAGPAEALRDRAGTLSPGARADLCIVDPSAREPFDPASIPGRGRNTPFAGRTLTGRVRHTMVGGREVHGAATPA